VLLGSPRFDGEDANNHHLAGAVEERERVIRTERCQLPRVVFLGLLSLTYNLVFPWGVGANLFRELSVLVRDAQL